ncbi:MAG TPA: NAD(P)/FAD-dependent oxidoreductase [Pyrinomonadaceae bacterium]|nr:NAD(P)/FAD-dependent oxidoreductase [Pyrinomonadaceae bacterium]
MSKYDVVIIGGGHNGLVAACYLAKSGLKTLVLERREVLGGGAELDHATGPFSQQIVADLKLPVEFITPKVRVLALADDGRSLCIYNNDTAATVKEIEKFSAKDAKAYPEFVESFSRIGRVLAPLVSMTPPSIDQPAKGDLWQLGKVGMAFRGLGKKDEYRLLRWGPMAIADLVAEWFETELLRATVAARGIHGALAGPWSAGTSLGLLWQAAMDGSAIAPSVVAKGLTQALVGASGAEIRTSAEVIRIESGKVILRNGEEIEARAVVSNADPRTTFLKLVDPIDLDPNFLSKMRNYRAPGVVAKIDLTLSGIPEFRGVDSQEKLTGRIHIGPEIDYLERAFDAAKYGEFSRQPYLDIAMTSPNKMSIHAQFAPYKLKEGDWNTRDEEFADVVIDTLAKYAPNIRDLIVDRRIITPVDLEQTYGLSGGHIHHGEQTLDQFFTFRPLIGWAQYRTPMNRLYLCGAGTHPGGGVTGIPGANAAREIARDFKSGKV